MSVIAVNASGTSAFGIVVTGAQSLVKSSNASNTGGTGIQAMGDRAQIQQSTANDNGNVGIQAGDNCLVTMNTATGASLWEHLHQVTPPTHEG